MERFHRAIYALTITFCVLLIITFIPIVIQNILCAYYSPTFAGPEQYGLYNMFGDLRMLFLNIGIVFCLVSVILLLILFILEVRKNVQKRNHSQP